MSAHLTLQQFAMLAAMVHSAPSFGTGMPLPELLQVLRGYLDEAKIYRQEVAFDMVAALAQLCANLAGEVNDVTVLTGEFMDQDTAIQKALDSKNHLTCFLLSTNLLYLGYMVQDHLMAEQHALLSRKLLWAVKPAYVCVQHVFLDGLNAAKLSRVQLGGQRRKQLRLVRKCLRMLTKASAHAPHSCLHKAHLLGAELDAATGRFDAALWKYKLSTALSRSDGFMQVEALGYELFAETLLDRRRFDDARRHIRQSCALNVKWGCNLKVDHLNRKLTEVRGAN